MKKLNVKKDDTVVVISGKDKGKKPRKQGETGGRIEHEGTINASNVMLVCPKCGVATRVGHAMDGDKKVRVCKKCGKNID